MHSHYSPAAERIYRIDAHSLHSLAPFVGGLSLQSVTATLRAGRNIGTRECSNVKPLRFRDTALAALLRCLLQLRCCTPLPLCNTLFQRLSLLSDTSLCPNLICEILRLLATLTRCEQASLLRWFDVYRIDCRKVNRKGLAVDFVITALIHKSPVNHIENINELPKSPRRKDIEGVLIHSWAKNEFVFLELLLCSLVKGHFVH